jgi:hypothetical protein
MNKGYNMKIKYAEILIISIILLIVCLNGCTDQNNNIDGIDDLEVVNYSIATSAYSHKTDWKNFGDGFQSDAIPEIVTHGPPYLSEEFTKARYKISVTVKNVAGKAINPVIINLNFFNINNTKLFTKQLNNFTKLPDSETRTLEWEYFVNDDKYSEYFYYVDHLEISTGAKPIDT